MEIGGLVALVGGVCALTRPTVWSMGPRHDPERVAEIQLRNLTDAIDLYAAGHKALPRTLQTLVSTPAGEPEAYLLEVHADPWGQSYSYRVDGASYSIRSFGRDGQPGTADDIVWPKPR